MDIQNQGKIIQTILLMVTSNNVVAGSMFSKTLNYCRQVDLVNVTHNRNDFFSDLSYIRSFRPIFTHAFDESLSHSSQISE